jgi:hypothetical protein
VFLLLVLTATPAFAGQGSVRPLDEEDAQIQAFLQSVETAVSTMDRARWMELLSASANRDEAGEFFSSMVPKGITRAVVKERDRAPLAGTLPGEGFRLIAEVFIETGPRGRIATWRLDIRRPRGQDLGPQPWRIVAEDHLASVDGLHRLALQPERQYAARNLSLRSVDFEIKLPAGDVFVAETPQGTTVLVLLGDGTIVFQPAPKQERGQLKLFAGTETLETPFTAAFVRLNPFDFEQNASTAMLEKATIDPRAFRRAQAIFDEDVAKSFSLDLSDLSRETWSLLPSAGDFVAEVRTKRFDTLTYARSSGEPEDVSLFQRARRRNISAYASEQKLSNRGRFYNEDDLTDYDVLDYNVEAAFQPDREWIDGFTKLKIRVKSYAMGVLTLRFAESLNVSSVSSDELGRLLFLKVRNQNSIVVNLPDVVARDYVFTINVAYSGRIERQSIQDESVFMGGGKPSGLPADGQRAVQPDDMPFIPAEPKWLFSNRNYWHPQGQVTDYATASLHITVPDGYGVVGSGVARDGSPTFVPGAAPGGPARLSYSFRAAQPVRYLGVLIGRFARIDTATVVLDVIPAPPTKELSIVPPGRPSETLQQQIDAVNAAAAVPRAGVRNTMTLNIEASRRQESKGRDAMGIVADIVRLYAGIVNDAPYESLTVAMVEDDVPGGHAPGYFAMINNPPPISAFTWRNDPASFQNFPEFFMAHEVAHQWFGQAVGWKNYHEQWLSEGFAQYFAALYAKERRGEPAFREILRQFRRWTLEDSDQGPVSLGYRLGHIKNESRVFRALVYNKGAGVVHMMRRLVGDEAFFRGLRRFYTENRYKKAGTDDLRKAMEQESGRDLSRFFERWIYDSTLPRVKFSSAVDGQELVVRFEQTGDVFDLPVTVTINYTDGKTAEHVVLATEQATEVRLPLTGTLRSVETNQDGAALAVIEKK